MNQNRLGALIGCFTLVVVGMIFREFNHKNENEDLRAELVDTQIELRVAQKAASVMAEAIMSANPEDVDRVFGKTVYVDEDIIVIEAETDPNGSQDYRFEARYRIVNFQRTLVLEGRVN